MKKWSRKFDKCIKCGTTERPCVSHGMCRKCYIKSPRYKRCQKRFMKKYMKGEHWKEYQKSERRQLSEKRRIGTRKEYLLQKKYGISLEQYNQMRERQDNVCLICNKLLRDGKYSAIDHNHESGEIRGILCSNCNIALGHFHDSIPTLKNAIKYLESN